MLPQAFDLYSWGLQCAAMALTALLIPNLKVTSIFGPVLAVIGLALINSYVWSSTLFSTIPDSISAQTGTLFLINGVIFWLVVKVMPGIETKGVLPSLMAPLVFSLCSLVITRYSSSIDWVAVESQSAKLIADAKRYVQANSHEPTHEKNKSDSE